MLVTTLVSITVLPETASARGPEYSGPETQPTGPAFFGPAPNAYPYCDSPTYFDPFPENVNPIGRMDVGSTASVETDGITMDLVLTAEGNPDTQYPGFFPQGGDGRDRDQPKGIEMAEGDAATVTLSEPLFYSQWIFTDVDQPDEGFTVTPIWTVPGQAAAFGGDEQFTFAGSNSNVVELDDIDGVGWGSHRVEGRVQVDFLGAVTGIQMERTFPSEGQSGFAVGGGCEAAGAAKALVAGPTWNGTSFDVTYELRMRNNLPSTSTIQAVIDEAVAATGTSFVSDTPQGIALNNLQLTDDLTDPAFSDITVTSLSTDMASLDLNGSYDGLTDINLLTSGEIPAESDGLITLSVQYTPDLSTANWDDCAAGYGYLNQTTVSGRAAGVEVTDVSDDGVSAAPSDDNGAGGVDDPTPVTFPCPPGGLQIVKTVVNGPTGVCPAFADGIVGDGPALPVTIGDTVTYCISVFNDLTGPTNDVLISDAQAPSNFDIGTLLGGEEQTRQYDLVVADSTPVLNTAIAAGNNSEGPINPVSDTALIDPSPIPQPILEIVKTVLPGADATCPAFIDGVAGRGTPLPVTDGDTVTYCIAVRNSGPGLASNVVITDPQAPQSYDIGNLATSDEGAASYNVVVTLNTEPVNTATAAGDGPTGPLPLVTDDAEIIVNAMPEPFLEIVKTAIAGPGGVCPSFDDGVAGVGDAVQILDGGVVTYCVSIRNSGPGVATNVTITDPQTPASPYDIGVLQSGAGETIQYDVDVTTTTPVDNVATATGNGPGGPLDPIDDPALIEVVLRPDPVLEIVKTALRGPNAACPSFDDGVQGLGDAVQFVETETVTYCLTVRNSGLGDATDVVMTDDQAPNTFDLTIGDLAAGDSATRSYDLVVTVDTPTVNTAGVTGNGVNGPVDPDEDDALIAVDLQADPILEIVKTVVAGPDGACPATFAEGVDGPGTALVVEYTDTVTYCINVRNVGGNAATDVTVTDPQAPGVFQIGTLPVGEETSRSYDIVVDDSTPATNTATVNGNGPNGAVDPDSDTALIVPGPQPEPILEIVKTVLPGPDADCPAFVDGVPGPGDTLGVDLNDVVTYCISIRNTGPGAAQNVAITDDQAVDSPFAIGDLAPGAEDGVSFDITVGLDTPLTNIATVTGTGPTGPVPQASDDTVIDVVDTRIANVALIHSVSLQGETCEVVAKDLNSLVANIVGTAVTWCAQITNTGNVPLTNVVLNAPAIGVTNVDALEVTNGGEALLPGETIFISLDGEITPAGLESDGTVTADPSDAEGNVIDLDPVDDADDAETREAAIDLQTTVVPGADGDCDLATEKVTVPTGETVTWCFTVTNTGTVDLLVEEVVDVTLGITVPIPADEQVLEPGESVTVTTTSEADGDIVNDAEVTGQPLDEDGTVLIQAPVVEDSDPAEIDTPTADLSLVKTNSNNGPVAVNTVITYTLAITQNGPDTAIDVKVTDQLPAGLSYVTVPVDDDWSCSLDEGDRSFTCLKATDMEAGDTATLTYTVNVGPTAALGADLVNTAVVDSPTPDPDETNNTDISLTSREVPVLEETGDPGPEYPGPFTTPELPDEVLGVQITPELAITGASSRLLGMLSVALLAVGSTLMVGSRRRRSEEG